MPQKSISMTLLAIQYIFNMYRNTESPYRNISRYDFARRYSPLGNQVCQITKDDQHVTSFTNLFVCSGN